MRLPWHGLGRPRADPILHSVSGFRPLLASPPSLVCALVVGRRGLELWPRGKPSRHWPAPTVGIELAASDSTIDGRHLGNRANPGREDTDTQVCRTSRYEEPITRKYPNMRRRKCSGNEKVFPQDD